MILCSESAPLVLQVTDFRSSGINLRIWGLQVQVLSGTPLLYSAIDRNVVLSLGGPRGRRINDRMVQLPQNDDRGCTGRLGFV